MKYITQHEQLSEITTTSDSEVDAFTFGVPVENGKSYMFLCNLETGDSGFGAVWFLRTDADAPLLGGYRTKQDSTDYFQQGAMGIYTSDADETHTFAFAWKRAAASGTVKARNIRVLVFELEAGVDFWTKDGDDTYSTTNTNYQNALTLTFSPASTKDYLIIGTGYLYNSRLGIRLRLEDGTTGVFEQSDLSMKSGSGGDCYAVMQKRNLTTGSKSFVTQVKAISGTASVSFLALVAIDLSALYAAQVTQDNADESGTNTSYTTTETLAATGLAPGTRDTVVLACSGVRAGSTSYNAGARLTEGGTAMATTSFEGGGSQALVTNFFAAFKSAAAGPSITYNLDRITENSSAATTMKGAVIAVLEFAPDSTPVEETIAGAARMDGQGYAPTILAGAGVMVSPASAAILEGVGYAPGVEVAEAVYLTVAGSGALVGAGYEVVVEVAEAVLLTLAAAGEFEGVGAAPDVVAGQTVDLTIAAAAQFIGTGYTPLFAVGFEATIAAAAQFVGLGAQPSTSIGVEVTVGGAEFEGAGAAPTIQAGQAVALTVAAGGRLEALGYVPGTLVGVLVTVAAGAVMEGEGYAPDLSIASGVDETIGGAAEFEGTGAVPSVLAGTGARTTVAAAAEFEGTGAAPDVLAGTGALVTVGDGAEFVGEGHQPFFVFGFSAAVGEAASFVGRGYRVTFGPQEPEDYVTTVSGTFGASGVSATLRLRNQVETVTYDFASPGSGTIALERSRTPDGTAWEIVAGPFKTAVVGTVVSRPNDRFRVRLRNYSAPVDYSIYDEDAIIREQRTAENEVIYQVKQSGLVVSGTITEV